MAEDEKLNVGDNPPEEPMPKFVIEANNAFFIKMLERYRELCVEYRLGSGATNKIDRMINQGSRWQRKNGASLPL